MFQILGNVELQTCQLLQRKRMAGDKRLHACIHCFVKIAKFGVPYFFAFATDSFESSHIYEIQRNKSSGEAYFLFEQKYIRKA